jgi:uncharacterized protein (TIGR03086 family)
MLNKTGFPDQVSLYRAAADRALTVADAVRADQLESPTPCSEWTVQQLIDHLVGGTKYLLSAAQQREPPTPPVHATSEEYRKGVADVLEALAQPAVMEQICISPLGFEWPVAQAVAGTFMDVLIHTWDLARATGQEDTLDSALVDACTALFLPDMPELGRAAGMVGPAVEVRDGASAQDRLLAAMGRSP